MDSSLGPTQDISEKFSRRQRERPKLTNTHDISILLVQEPIVEVLLASSTNIRGPPLRCPGVNRTRICCEWMKRRQAVDYSVENQEQVIRKKSATNCR